MLKRSYFKRKPTVPMKRTKLRVVGHSSSSELKAEIQALLRKSAIKRDKTCVLADYPETGACGSHTKSGNLILQAEHLNSRSNTATFGDMRNIVLLCQRHHIYWKPQNSELYWKLIKEIIGKERWAWYQRAKEDRRAYKIDLQLVKLGLEQDLKKYENS